MDQTEGKISPTRIDLLSLYLAHNINLPLSLIQLSLFEGLTMPCNGLGLLPVRTSLFRKARAAENVQLRDFS